MKCTKINHPNLQPGFGCCKCKVYNGDQRTHCKNCDHPRCDNIAASDKELAESTDVLKKDISKLN